MRHGRRAFGHSLSTLARWGQAQHSCAPRRFEKTLFWTAMRARHDPRANQRPCPRMALGRVCPTNRRAACPLAAIPVSVAAPYPDSLPHDAVARRAAGRFFRKTGGHAIHPEASLRGSLTGRWPRPTGLLSLLYSPSILIDSVASLSSFATARFGCACAPWQLVPKPSARSGAQIRPYARCGHGGNHNIGGRRGHRRCGHGRASGRAP